MIQSKSQMQLEQTNDCQNTTLGRDGDDSSPER